MTTTALLPAAQTYGELVDRFQWHIPAIFNIAAVCCDRWADGSGRVALIHVAPDGRTERITFDALRSTAARVANVLKAQGVGPGDRVAVLLAQGPEAAIAHLAIYRLGAIAVPLFQLFGPDALEFRLRNSGACAVVTNDVGLGKLDGVRDRLTDLRVILNADGARPGVLSLWEEAERARDDHRPVETAPDDPALII